MRLVAFFLLVAAATQPAVPPITEVIDSDITYTVQYRVAGDGVYNYGTAATIKDADVLHRKLLAAIQNPDSDLHTIYVEGRLLWTRVKFNNP